MNSVLKMISSVRHSLVPSAIILIVNKTLRYISPSKFPGGGRLDRTSEGRKDTFQPYNNSHFLRFLNAKVLFCSLARSSAHSVLILLQI